MVDLPKSEHERGRLFVSRSAVLLSMLLCTYTLHSQPGAEESRVNQAVEHAINTIPVSQLGIFNGVDYTPTTVTAGGHPYLSTEEFTLESISFDGILYRHIDLLFDAAQQRVVIEDHAGNKICPPAEKIEAFTAGVHTFKRLSSIDGLDPGYYDELVEQSLYARRTKSLKGLRWTSSTEYFFISGSRSFQMKNKKAVLEIMADEEHDVREYINRHKLSFSKKKKERSLIEVTKFYSSLKRN